MPPVVRLYWAPWSHYSVCAELQLAIKEVPATLVPVPYHDKTDLVAKTGQDYIPELDWDGTFVPWEAIPDFLERAVYRPTLYPNSQRGAATIIERWAHQVLEDKVWKGVVTKVADTFSDPREAWVFEYLQTRVRGPWKDLEDRREDSLRVAAAELGWVDAALHGRDWILGAPSLADCGVYGAIAPLLLVGEPVPAGLDHLRNWVNRMHSLRRQGPWGSLPGAR